MQGTWATERLTLKTQGIAILMVASELPEVLGVADRIVVMHQGRTVADLSHGATESVKSGRPEEVERV